MPSPSPQRRRWVTEPEEIGFRPQAFAILPQYEDGVLVAFTVQDPEGDTIRSRAKIAEAIHNQYPAVSISELEDARISYYDYYAVVVLRR